MLVRSPALLHSLATSRQLGRRSSVAILAVIAIAVATLGVLVGQTSQQEGYGALASAGAQQLVFSERVLSTGIAANAAVPQERAVWRQRLHLVISEWDAASRQLRGELTGGATIPTSSPARESFARLASVQTLVAQAAEQASADEPPPGATETLFIHHALFQSGMNQVLEQMDVDSERQVERLVQLEAVCVILLLAALGVAVRLALQPTQDRLDATVAALAESESRNRAVLDAMSEGMILTDRGGQLIARNPSADRLLRRSADEDDTIQSLSDMLEWVVNEAGEPLRMS